MAMKMYKVTRHVKKQPPQVEKMTLENAKIADSEGDTPLHYSTLFCWPREVFTKETVFAKNNKGITPLHIAARYNLFKYIPAEFITRENLLTTANNGQTPLHYAGQAKANTLPFALLSPEDMNLPSVRGTTPLYYLTLSKNLDKVPPEMFTEDGLVKRIPCGPQRKGYTTVLHEAAKYASLGCIPRKFFKEENLICADSEGYSVLSLAKYSSDLDPLLGIRLSDKCREMTGDIWFARNQKEIDAMDFRDRTLQEPTHEEAPEIDIF